VENSHLLLAALVVTDKMCAALCEPYDCSYDSFSLIILEPRLFGWYVQTLLQAVSIHSRHRTTRNHAYLHSGSDKKLYTKY